MTSTDPEITESQRRLRIVNDLHPAELDGELSLPANQSASMYQIRCEDCPERATIGPFKHASWLGRCHAHFKSHQVIVEVFE
jgi:hypothetical protein